MGDEYANPITGQPYDTLSPAEYAGMRRRRIREFEAAHPVTCFDCGTLMQLGTDYWHRWRNGTLEPCCQKCAEFGEQYDANSDWFGPGGEWLRCMAI